MLFKWQQLNAREEILSFSRFVAITHYYLFNYCLKYNPSAERPSNVIFLTVIAVTDSNFDRFPITTSLLNVKCQVARTNTMSRTVVRRNFVAECQMSRHAEEYLAKVGG